MLKIHFNHIAILTLLIIGFAAHAETATTTTATQTEAVTATVTVIEGQPQPITLNYRCVGEEKFNGNFIRPKYLTEEESKKYVLVQDAQGLLLNMDGEKFDTTGLRNDLALYVVDMNGTIYSSRIDTPIEFEHSSYLAGKPVMCAGYWHVVDGDIQLINDRSYKYITLDHKNLDWCMEFMKKRGMDFNEVPVFYSSDEI